jgi:hypothetical protein
MRYEAPEVTSWPAITAIQSDGAPKTDPFKPDSGGIKEVQSAYEDWED